MYFKPKYENGVSVCIPAYKAQDFIEECLDSVQNQNLLNVENYEIILGIDGCQDTLNKVKEIMNKYTNLKVFMMDKNYGSFITLNTIISLAQYDKIIVFAADDVMLENMVQTLVYNSWDSEQVISKLKNFGSNDDVMYSCGACLYKHEMLDYFGGFMPWVCSADVEIIRRTNRFIRIKYIDIILFNRRMHDGNLTVQKETNCDSDIRKKYISYIRNISSNIEHLNDAIIETIKGSYVEIK